MPATTRSTRSTTQPANRGRATNSTSTRQPAGNGPRKPNGTGNGPKPNGAWPVELVLAAEVELAIEGKDASIEGFAICTRCAALLPGSEISRTLHVRFHESIDGIDQRTGR